MDNSAFNDSLIFKRHSVRKYVHGPIAPEHAEHIMHAAMAAPSAHNCQPWFFVFIDDRAILNAIAGFHPYAKMLADAAAAIVVCAVREITQTDEFYQQDLAAATQNILLAATECGVGSCWCGIHPIKELEKAFVDLLHMPEQYFPFSLISLGNVTQMRPPSDRYDGTRVKRNGW